MADQLCPCGSGAIFADCCGPLLAGQVAAHSPEALMRSRYSAWHFCDIDYLWNTLHPEGRAATSKDKLRESAANTHWLSLRIIDAPPPAAGRGVVEFSAFFHAAGTDISKTEQLHERSEFRRRDDHWYYLSGTFLPPVKTGRNDPCWCGSAKKLKKCHPNT